MRFDNQEHYQSARGTMDDENSNFYKMNEEQKGCRHNLNLQLWGMIRAAD